MQLIAMLKLSVQERPFIDTLRRAGAVEGYLFFVILSVCLSALSWLLSCSNSSHSILVPLHT